MIIKQKLIVTRGIQGSGKSTWAKEYCEENIASIRIERDMLRKQLFNHDKRGLLPKEHEDYITQAQTERIHHYLSVGWTVVISDTNLGSVQKFVDLAKEYGVEFELKVFDTPVEVCIERNAARPEQDRVPEEVIRKAYKRFKNMNKNYKVENRQLMVSSEKANAVMFDLDGTLRLMTGRSPYNSEAAVSDMPNMSVAFMLNALRVAYPNLVLIGMSGASASSRDMVCTQIREFGVDYHLLFMREVGDSRSDSIVKAELYHENVEPYFNVIAVFDDRGSVCKTWVDMGLHCFNVRGGVNDDF